MFPKVSFYTPSQSTQHPVAIVNSYFFIVRVGISVWKRLPASASSPSASGRRFAGRDEREVTVKVLPALEKPGHSPFGP
jgi:hypothetical protein